MIVSTLDVEVLPFSVPSTVRGVNIVTKGVFATSITGGNEYPLSSLDEDALNKLCDQFRDDVFRMAGLVC